MEASESPTGSGASPGSRIFQRWRLKTLPARAAAYRAIQAEVSRMIAESKLLPVLIIDKAHHLRNEILEELRLRRGRARRDRIT